MSSPSLSTWPLFHLPPDVDDPGPASAESRIRDAAAADHATYEHNRRRWPPAPPWRRFLPEGSVNPERDQETWLKLLRLQDADRNAERRGGSFRLGADSQSDLLLQAVNAAIHLRRPLLVRGEPGTGKTSLAYALAHRLRLGPVLHWRITSRTRLVDGLYRYDALGLLQDLQRDEFQLRRLAQIPVRASGAPPEAAEVPAERQLADYISLGPVGTAFLPSLLPRVLLIDEIDKADPQLPNELLHLLEEGEFDIPELARERRHQQRLGHGDALSEGWELATADLLPREDIPPGAPPEHQRIEPLPVLVKHIPVRCCQFPIIVMTSNDERDFSPAFKRRCLPVSMPYPTSAQLLTILRSHFNQLGEDYWASHQETLNRLIQTFKQTDNPDRHDRATDQLLNFIHLFTEKPAFRPTEEALAQLERILLRRLGTSGDN